ncbi:MAG TPA: GtrA family protein [Oscillospiraceae bacterium]|nr:GtrA family protein [Oscillospiraceae bacterium]
MELKALIKKHRETINYIIFGVATTIVNYLVYILFTRFFHTDETVANIIAWACSVIFAFLTNKRWVFKSKTSNIKEYLIQLRDFVAARLFSGAIDIFLVWLSVDVLGYNEGVEDLIAKALSNVVVLTLNYLLSKFLVFRKKSE